MRGHGEGEGGRGWDEDYGSHQGKPCSKGHRGFGGRNHKNSETKQGEYGGHQQGHSQDQQTGGENGGSSGGENDYHW